MPRRALYEVRWDATAAAYRASDALHPITQSTWGTWLAQHRTFAFQGHHGRINMLKERRTGGENGYWYAYRRQGKRISKQYAGRAEQLTLTHLEEITRLMYAAPPKGTTANMT